MQKIKTVLAPLKFSLQQLKLFLCSEPRAATSSNRFFEECG